MDGFIRVICSINGTLKFWLMNYVPHSTALHFISFDLSVSMNHED